MPAIEDIIAKAIKEGDDSYFFENYTKQAFMVLKALRTHGYCIVPLSPTPEMEKAGIKAITYGTTKPALLVKKIYEDMIEEA